MSISAGAEPVSVMKNTLCCRDTRSDGSASGVMIAAGMPFAAVRMTHKYGDIGSRFRYEDVGSIAATRLGF